MHVLFGETEKYVGRVWKENNRVLAVMHKEQAVWALEESVILWYF
jgi:hypothetical protein